MRALRVRVVSASIAISVCACAPRDPKPAQPPQGSALPSGTVAAIGAGTLLLETLRRRVVATAAGTDPCPRGPDACSEPAKRLVRRALEDMVNDLVVAHHARHIGVRVERSEIDDAIATMAKSAHLTTDALFAAARRQEIDDDELRRLVEARLLLSKTWERGPGASATPLPKLEKESDERAAITATYEEWIAEPGRVRAEVRVLGFHAAPGNEKYVEDSLAAVRDRAEKGEDFCTLVKTYAHNDEARNNCGSLGPLPLQLLSPEIRAVVGGMKPLQIVGPLTVRDGRVLVQLVDLPRPPSLDDVYPQIWRLTVERARREAVTTWLRDLGRGYGLVGGELTKSDAAMLESEVLRARRVPTLEESAREAEVNLATEIIRNALRDWASTR